MNAKDGDGSHDARKEMMPPPPSPLLPPPPPRALSALERASEASEMLQDCIAAREDLGVLMARRLKDSGPACDCCGDHLADHSGEADEEAVAVAAAAREFAEKMAELADVAPGLSRLLEGLTETTLDKGKGADGAVTQDDSANRPETESPASSGGDSAQDVQELLRVVSPALARLLSFDHLRASSSIAHTLVQALVNLSVGLSPSPGGTNSQENASEGSAGSASVMGISGSSASFPQNASTVETRGHPATSQSRQERIGRKAQSWVVDILLQAFAPKIYGGKWVRSTGLDALLGANYMDASTHHRAIQVELVRRAHALQGVIGDALESKRRTSSRKRPAPLPNYNPVPHRKIANTTNAASQSLHNGTDSANNTPSVFQADSQREGFGGFEQLFAGNGMGFPLEEEEEDARWRHTGQGSSKDPAESLFESISKAFCCMSGGGPREDRRPMQVLLSRLLLDSYRLLAAPERREWSSAPLGGFSSATFSEISNPFGTRFNNCSEFSAGLQKRRDRLGEKVITQRTNPAGLRTNPAGPGKNPTGEEKDEGDQEEEEEESASSPKHSPIRLPSPPPRLPRAPPLPSPHPADWERRMRESLTLLRRRPLLCPEELLQRTGAVPSSSQVRTMSEPRVSFDGDGVMGAGGGRGGELGQRKARAVNSAVGFGVRGEGGESSGSPVTEACLLVALDLTEGAVLENRSGEAAAGLLRALRTGRGGWGSSGMWGGLRGRGGGSALAGGGRGQVEGGVMSALVEKLEETPAGCLENSIGALVWALQDMGQRYGGEANGAGPDGHSLPPWRAFGTDLWLLLVGYRHWQMVAMLQLLSLGRCVLCKLGEWMKPKPKARPENHQNAEPAQATPQNHEPPDEQQQQEQTDGSAWLLAWFACGGVGSAQRMQQMRGAIDSAAGELTSFDLANSSSSSYIDASPDVIMEGDDGYVDFSKSGRLSATEVLRRAGQAGQGQVGNVFGPCMAFAWLLVSPVALEHCESVLASVFYPDDFEKAFGGGVPEGGVEESADGILLCLSAIEDLVWLCSLEPPLSHVHRDRPLRHLLARMHKWLSGLTRCGNAGPEGKQAANSGTCAGGVNWLDFVARRDELCRRLQGLSHLLSSRSH